MIVDASSNMEMWTVTGKEKLECPFVWNAGYCRRSCLISYKLVPVLCSCGHIDGGRRNDGMGGEGSD